MGRRSQNFRDITREVVLFDIRERAPAERVRIWDLLQGIEMDQSVLRRVQASYMRAWRRDQYSSAKIYARKSFALSLITTVQFFCYMVYADWGSGGEGPSSFSTTLVVSLFLACAGMANALIAMNVERHRDFASYWACRSDLLLYRLILLASSFYRCKWNWQHRSACRRLRSQVNRAARDVAITRVRLRRADWLLEWRLRSELRSENARVAACLRTHADALARAGNQADYERICHSLQDALILASIDDWESILEGSPEVTHVSMLVRFGTRLVPSVTLLACAFALPLLPPFEGAGNSIRNVLLPMAALAALGASESVSASVRVVLEKTIFSGK
jgi:hypothetical protein